MPKDIRLINSHYDDLYRIPDGGVIQVDYPDGRSFTAKLEHLDDYHFDMGGLGNVFHICQFADVMGRNHADFYPEIQTQDNQGAWELGGKGYIAIQSCDDGWDYTLYHSDFSVMDGGQVDAPELTIQEVREQILAVFVQMWYALALYLLLDHPQMKARESLKISRQIMKGNKGRLFYIYLSFIGLQILCLLSLGIGSLWVYPYQSQTLVIFYLDVVGEIPSNIS